MEATKAEQKRLKQTAMVWLMQKWKQKKQVITFSTYTQATDHVVWVGHCDYAWED